MVLVTPRLVRPLNPDEVPPLPTTLPGHRLAARLQTARRAGATTARVMGSAERQVQMRHGETEDYMQQRGQDGGGERGAILVHAAFAHLGVDGA